MSKGKIWARVAVVFISGMLAGSALTGLYMKNSTSWTHKSPGKMVMKKLASELNLTKEQEAAVGKIVGDTQLKLQKLRAEYHPQMEAIIRSGIDGIKPNLSAEQKKKLDELYRKIALRWQKKRGMREER